VAFLNIYQKYAQRTSPDGHDRILNGLLGLIGESGEIVDLIKKYKFQSTKGTPLPKERLIEEIGDVMWYLAELATGLRKELSGLVEKKPIYSLFDPFVYGMGKSVETAAALTAHFAGKCFISINFEENAMILQASLYDTYCSLKLLCELIGTTIEYAGKVNIDKLKERYPDGFDAEKSMNRPEYAKSEQESEHLFIRRNKIT